MGRWRSMITRQPKPSKNNPNPAVWDIVIKEMKARDDFGLKKYGARLKANNGRDTLQDLYEELLDAIVYCRTLMYERDGK